MSRTLAILGFGAFGRFMASHLRHHFDVRVHDRRDIAADAASLHLPVVPLDAAAAAEIVVLTVPVQHMPPLLAELAPRLRPDALVLDVASVKLRPIELMLGSLCPTVRIIGTHPLFGPQSGKCGVAGLPIALCPVRADASTVSCVREFLGRTLALNVIDVSPDEHDRQMAWVQGLTHYLSRAVGSLPLPESPLATVAYQRFLAMRDNLRHDSEDLFLTIERENPYALEVRRALRAKLDELDRSIGAS